ncbi:hypothetical protein CAOG_00079 [Capsaspora owczarzaki ATCC 30864]|uniref:Uncharacterized protein n=1 Tax=Capsaspora owczarzaki (strain ATCC 30864) TaxID=595528 RepID=A0A0D2TZR1_CAPO3|nr:hypothetical protein CAOG_00079 [Capsaspora owczarzaki ATCC 30864]KJE88421.1 hypothetical protein CAOG_000079 [Capsaspora owczarzaki ATCC 30864]|eukprot:XP_004364950.2 hypothetical protein CAOG_00079 [Capsaspora owczarzaki ATCC 30864]
MLTKGIKAIYTNHRVFSAAGQLMFLCDDRKLNWYLKRSLAVELNPNVAEGDEAAAARPLQPAALESSPAALLNATAAGAAAAGTAGPRAIRLTFTPKGLGRVNDPFYLQALPNRCFVCGAFDRHVARAVREAETPAASQSGLASGDNSDPPPATIYRCHVVPSLYRRHFPRIYKSHAAHDVLRLCGACIRRLDPVRAAVMKQLAKEFGVPVDTSPPLTEYEQRVERIARLGSALNGHSHNMPPARVELLTTELLGHVAFTQLAATKEGDADLLPSWWSTSSEVLEHLQQVVDVANSILSKSKSARKVRLRDGRREHPEDARERLGRKAAREKELADSTVSDASRPNLSKGEGAPHSGRLDGDSGKDNGAIRANDDDDDDDDDDNNNDNDDEDDDDDDDDEADHGRLVVARLSTDAALLDFVRRWRRAFVQSLRPQHLPAHWSIDRSLDMR